jgi:hypothetical protein
MKKNNKRIFVTFQKEGLHKWPDATQHPGVEFLANEHRHMFHFRVDLQVFHDDREVEFILFKRELEGLYTEGTLQLDYKSCEMMADELGEYITDKYSGRHFSIEVSEDGENGCLVEFIDNAQIEEAYQRTEAIGKVYSDDRGELYQEDEPK